MLEFRDWIAIATVALNAIGIPVLIWHFKWVLSIEKKLARIDAMLETGITSLASRRRTTDGET